MAVAWIIENSSVMSFSDRPALVLIMITLFHMSLLSVSLAVLVPSTDAYTYQVGLILVSGGTDGYIYQVSLTLVSGTDGYTYQVSLIYDLLVFTRLNIRSHNFINVNYALSSSSLLTSFLSLF